MLKKFLEYYEELNDEQLGRLLRMCFDVMKNKEVSLTDDRIVNLLFKTVFRDETIKQNNINKRNQENGKKGGRPKKKGVFDV